VLVMNGRQRRSVKPNCRNTGAFEQWLADFKKEGETKGISPPPPPNRNIAAASAVICASQASSQYRPRAALLAQNSSQISTRCWPAAVTRTDARQRFEKASGDIRTRGKGLRRGTASVITALGDGKEDFGSGKGKGTKRSNRWQYRL